MTAKRSREFKTIQGIRMDIEWVGQGEPLILLLGEEASRERSGPIVEELARSYEVIIPYAPGFGRSDRPNWITTPDDISYLMLDVVDDLGLRATPVIGFSLGGWIALHMATKDTSFSRKLFLTSPYGVKIGGPYDRDIQDIWAAEPSRVVALKWAEPEVARRDYSAMDDEEVRTIAREVESFARFCWEPYMHDPKLKYQLHRVKIPTLFLWGVNDGVTTMEYGRSYSRLVPGAQFVTIPDAAHYPQIEQPHAVMREICSFLA